jgi:hypothetical protein
MVKVIVSAVWTCIITLISSYTAASWKAHGTSDDGKDGLTGLNYQKTEPINVPIIIDGGVKGYVVAQFVYTADAKTLNKLSVPPDAFISDAAFRAIYEDDKIDVDHIERYDLAALTTKLKETANSRFGVALLQDVLVQQFTYVSKEEVRAQAGATADIPVLSAESTAAGEGVQTKPAHGGEAARPVGHGDAAPAAHE